MSECKELCSGVRKIAWGYLFLYLNVNLGTINLLPNWVFYLLLLQALPCLIPAEPTIKLLRPLAWILGFWEAIVWLLAAFGERIQIEVLQMLSMILSLYLNFQLLTDLASISEQKCFPETATQILRLRTISTVLTTVYNLHVIWPFFLERWPDLTNVILIILAFCFFIVALLQCRTLFCLGRFLESSTDSKDE